MRCDRDDVRDGDDDGRVALGGRTALHWALTLMGRALNLLAAIPFPFLFSLFSAWVGVSSFY